MPIFTEAITLVRVVEAHLVSEIDSTIPLVSYFKRLIWMPTKFLKIGVDEKIKGTFVWAFLSLAFFILGAWFIRDSGVTKTEVANIIMLIATIVPMFLVTFAMPSMYGDSGVSKNNVEFVVQHLQTRGFASVKDIDYLKNSVKLFEDRSRSRVNVLKWLVRLLWAVFMYMISRFTEHSMSSPTEQISFFFMLAGMFMGVIVSYLCVWGYDAALDKLFRAIEFGCNDFCYVIEVPSAAII